MIKARKPIQGQPFNDVLNELHAHAITSVPDESDPFVDDIDRLVVFMKAATSKNRTDPIILTQLRARGVAV